MEYPNFRIFRQIGKRFAFSPAPMELLTNAPVVTAKELTMTKNRVETLLVILETANSVLPKCSIPTKKQEPGGYTDKSMRHAPYR